MTIYCALKDAITKILYGRRQLRKWAFNNKIISDDMKERTKEQIIAFDLFFNVFTDNLHKDVKNVAQKEDLFIFGKLFNSVFTLNTLYDMRISKQGISDLLELKNLTNDTNDVINNYSNIITKISEPVIVNNAYYSTYLYKLLMYVFFVWMQNYDLLLSDIEGFNIIVQTYKVIITKESKFIDINHQLSTEIQDINKQKNVIDYLVSCETKYVILSR